MSIANATRFMNSLHEMKDSVRKDEYCNFIHITHTDLDGVSCALVDHLGPERIIRTQYVDTVFTPKMIPELYDVIENTIKEWLQLQRVYNSKIEDLWILITDFGSIEIDKLNDITAKVLLKDGEQYDINLKSVHFIIIDHHQSKYTKIDTSAISPAESSADYSDRFCGENDPYKLSCGSFYFKPEIDTTDKSSTTTAAHQEFNINNEVNVSVDMFICNDYCASTLWFTLADRIEWTDAFISDAKITTDYFYQVNEYDLGRQGEFIINLDQLEGESKVAYAQAIIDKVSPQMILNCRLNQLVSDLSEMRYYKGLTEAIPYLCFIEEVYDIIMDERNPNTSAFSSYYKKWNTHKCYKCGYIIPFKKYYWTLDREDLKCPECGSTNLEDITTENAIDAYINHPSVAYQLACKVTKMICRMNVVYEDFLHNYCEEIIDDAKPHKDYIFMGYLATGEPTTMLVDFPEDKNYHILYQVYRNKLPEEVNTHTFAKLAMKDMDRRGIHIDMSMIFSPNDDGKIICQLTVNPNNTNNINCYDVAVLNGGGGHPGAAGFHVKRINVISEVKNN